MTGLTFEELHRCPVCVAVHPAHRLAQMRKVCLEQVARERLITYTAADYPEYRAWLAGLFAPLKLAPQIAEEHDSATSVIAAAEAGRGVALVARNGLGQCLAYARARERHVVKSMTVETRRIVKYWEIIADNFSKAGWSWGCVSAMDSHGRTMARNTTQMVERPYD